MNVLPKEPPVCQPSARRSYHRRIAPTKAVVITEADSSIELLRGSFTRLSLGNMLWTRLV